MLRTRFPKGFSLVELLVCMAVIAILASVLYPLCQVAIVHAHCSGCSSRMRTIGMGFMSYAGDNDERLPSRVVDAAQDKWPTLLLPYVGNPVMYVDPGDPVATKVPVQNLVSNSDNNSSFFFNGFNDLGYYNNPSATVTLATLTDSSNLLLLGQKINGNTQYYMDFVEGNQDDILNKTAYFGGSNYVFADGSAQWLSIAKYADTMWLVNKDYAIPAIPPGH